MDDGIGQSEFYGRPCKRCNGVGVLSDQSCPLCRGKLDGPDLPCRQPFGDKIISVVYLRKLQRIPGLLWNIGSAGVKRPDDGPYPGSMYRDRDCCPILFRGDGGIEGMVMPMAK